MEKISRASERAAKRQYWQEQFENWKESGLTQAEYCRRHGLKQHQWWYWKKRLIDSAAPGTYPTAADRSIKISNLKS